LVEDRRVPFLRFIFLLLLVAVCSPIGAAAGQPSVEAVDRLLRVGASGLALRVIGEEQPQFSRSPVAWQRWERLRLRILESRGDWSALIARVAEYPPALPDDFATSAQESLARAHLARGDAEAAGAVIAGLIWGQAQETAMVSERRARLTRWRALLVESQLLAGRLGEAETTVLRYRLDYGADPRGWRLSRAKALIRVGRDDEARALLADVESTEVRYLKLLLRARDAALDPVELLSEMAPLLGEGRLVAAERAQLWASLASAAARYRDHQVRVTAMEQAVALRGAQHARDRFVAIEADDLWNAYQDYAAALGNQAQLLVGRFDDWLALADRYGGAGDVEARALYAYLSNQNRDARVADAARSGLVNALARESRGLRILGALYLDSRRHADIAALDPALRAPLVAYALAESHPDLAGQLLAGLDAQARRGLSARWRAPVAVALIADDRIDEALALFGEDDEPSARAEPVSTQALVRVAMALQTAGEYAHAARLLATALRSAESPWERRELLLLAAEAEAGAGQHARAARLYIESAAVPGGGPADAWSRAARLQAARALSEAGLDADAVRVLESTLADSGQPDVRVLVEHALRRF
jgi:hypothetical protein